MYLCHQPYAIWLGEFPRPAPLRAFLAYASAAMAVLAAVSMAIERRLNTLVARVLA